MLYDLLRPLLSTLPPEVAHSLSTAALDWAAAVPGVAAALGRCTAAQRPTEVFGLRFPNPVGLAAGFDKDARHLRGLAALGFGFIEVGSVTAEACAGNPWPRLFRLPRDGALINRMGLNNAGAQVVAARLQSASPDRPIFVNVAKTPATPGGAAAVADYLRSLRWVAPRADVVVLNISCPNTGDGRTFEEPEALDALLSAAVPAAGGTPVLLKISPDLDPEGVAAVVARGHAHGVSGFTATNTTQARTGLHTGPSRLGAVGAGGLSGAPLHGRAVATVRALRAQTALPIVGVGGVHDAATAQALLDAGAQLVQLYTGFIYGGPRVVRRICAGLA